MNQYIGKMLDNRYEILDVIGVGGMAVVYKAYCHRLHRFVAIKVLKRDLAADAEFRRRFHEEAQAVAMLSHPNIVSVYDVSKGDDLDYIVMELIEGETLKQRMAEHGVFSATEALHYATQICKALQHAHAHGIVHRDIKPQNIMITNDDMVKVADFGIAALEKELLAQNATYQDWCSTTELMKKTANGQDTIFMHPLPADISGVSCEHGEVNADVFDMHRVGMYKEASYKPYAIAAMMFLQKVADPAATLKALDERNTARWLQA